MSSLFGIGGGGNVGAAGGFYSYSIDQSLRFDRASSARLMLDPIGSPTGSTKCTISFWIKRTTLGASQYLFTGEQSNIYYDHFQFNPSDQLQIIGQENASSYGYRTNAVFRDVGAWYHVVLECDSTLATGTDRYKVYVNNVQQTLTSIYGVHPQNHAWYWNKSGNSQNIGRSENYSNYYGGYMAEFNFIDGQALDPTSFGETINGIWVPKQYSGSYGTNGFYLSFADSSAIGDDLSGNTNDFTANNLAASDVVPDSPTLNYSTWNPLRKGANFTTSEGNLKAVTNATVAQSIAGTFGMSSGKWYWEVRNEGGSLSYTGIVDDSHAVTTYIGSSTTGSGYAYNTSGQKVGPTSGTAVAYGATYTTGDIIGIALDMDAGTLVFYKNGVSQGTAFTGITGTWFAATSGNGVAGKGGFANFGQDSTFAGATTAGGNADDNGYGDFKHAPPSGGFLALCSANLPEPTISPNAEAQADDYFNTVLYTGTGASNSITGVGFGSAPDFTWIKSRSAAYNNVLWDTVRGATKQLSSNTTGAESTQAQGLTSFDSDGFTLGTNANLNNSGSTYVAWNWKAGGTAVSNTDGDITSSVSANQDAGFSIVSYTGTGANATVGHGLAETPEIVIVKNRDYGSGFWATWTKFNTNDTILGLDLTNALFSSPGSFIEGDINDTTIGVGTERVANGSTERMIAYCFHSVDGFSKVGTYVGNGSTDGPFIYTGFRPAWVMHKTVDTTANHWSIRDNKRDIDNEVLLALYANLTNADDTGGDAIAIDFLSNGFKPRRTNSQLNQSGTKYIYLAFAEAPFKYANAR